MNPFSIAAEIKAALIAVLLATIMFFRGEAHHYEDLYQRSEASILAAKAAAEAQAKVDSAQAAEMRAQLAASEAKIQSTVREVLHAIPASASCPDLTGFLRSNARPDLPAVPAGTRGLVPAGADVAPALGAPAAQDIAADYGSCEQAVAENAVWRRWYKEHSK